MSEDNTRAVFVSNISPNATEKTVSDFFSFCGRITKLTLRKEAISQDGSQEAIVIFETDSAAKTALLLTNALIVDRPITVVPHVPSASDVDAPAAPAAHSETQPENITSRQFTTPDSERSKTSVVASMIAAGYVLGSDAATNAREFDEKHMISLQLKVGAEQVKAKANELDKALHITETANVIKTATLEKAKEVDEKLHISEKVNQAADAVKFQANAFANKAAENEVVIKGMGLLSSLSSTIQQSFQQSFQSLKDESMAIVAEKRAEQGTSGVTPSTTTASDTATTMEVDTATSTTTTTSAPTDSAPSASETL
jgi:RNA recognition motif-containing protein